MPDRSILDELADVIANRRDEPLAKSSYVATLLKGGVARIGAKITEEASEVVEAAGEAGSQGRAHLVHEVADLVFHTLVLLGHQRVEWCEIEHELAGRFGVGGHEEKAARGQD